MSMRSFTEASIPPGYEDTGPQTIPLEGSLSIEKNMGSSPGMSPPPGWENLGSQPNHAHPIAEKSMGSCEEIYGPPGFENAGPEPDLLEGAVNIENTGSSPETTGPPGWEHFAFQPTLLPGSQSIEKSMVSSPEMSPPPGWEREMTLPPGLEREMTPPPGWENVRPQPIPAPSSPEMVQLVCGSCRQLLAYPRGTTHVKCPCCQIINFVLEEHQVGNVKCGKCCVLLMYPYGAPAVRCSSCRFVTEIGAHNSRPPLSVHQGRFPVPQNPNPVH